MRSAFEKILAWIARSAFWRREEIVHHRWELGLMRVLFVLVLFDAPTKLLHVMQPMEGQTRAAAVQELTQIDVIPRQVEYQKQPRPNSIAHFVNLTWLGKPAVAQVVWIGFYVATLLYLFGVALPLALGWMFITHFCHHVLHNSQGSIHHHQQLISLIFALQWIAVLWETIRSRKWLGWLKVSPEAGQLMANWTRQATVAAYVVSAVSKLYYSKGMWVWNLPRLGVQLRKAADQDYYDTLQASTMGHEWLPEWCVAHPWLARGLFGPALFLELFFFLALRNRRIGAVYALGLIAFHLSVSTLMSLDFRHNIGVLFIYFVNLPWWLGVGRKSNTEAQPDATQP